jgi:hypothetical protein
MNPYTYTVLRYVHDTTTGEFLNVGVVLLAPEARFMGYRFRKTYGRLAKAFPSVDGEAFRSIIRAIESQFDARAERLAIELPFGEQGNAFAYATSVLPSDDSSLQWSPFGSGVTDDPQHALDHLFQRMVRRYDDSQTARKTDDDVWRSFKHELETRRLLNLFAPKKIGVADDDIEFQYAWKNGIWHCLESLSFDLSSADGIRDKAHRWLGQMTSIQATDEQFKVYLLVGPPGEADLTPAFDKAVSILGKMPVSNEIFLEQQADDLSAEIEKVARTQLPT